MKRSGERCSGMGVSRPLISWPSQCNLKWSSGDLGLTPKTLCWGCSMLAIRIARAQRAKAWRAMIEVAPYGWSRRDPIYEVYPAHLDLLTQRGISFEVVELPLVPQEERHVPRPIKAIDIYLPLDDNDGRPIKAAKYIPLEDELLTRFGGVTSNQRLFPLRRLMAVRDPGLSGSGRRLPRHGL